MKLLTIVALLLVFFLQYSDGIALPNKRTESKSAAKQKRNMKKAASSKAPAKGGEKGDPVTVPTSYNDSY
jgi:hypothetical protein